MARKKHYDAKKITDALIKRTDAYADTIRRQFSQTVSDILDLYKRMPTLGEGEMFSFDAQSARIQKQVETQMRRLHSAATLAVKQGVEVEWDNANAACDALVSSCFGKKILESEMYGAWLQRNTEARDAFLARSVKGLNLSERIWKPVQQLRDEMEVAMTVAIGEGQSAQAMSRKVCQYLNDPDLMFRRFRYKDENGQWQRKWKKRVKDEKTGKYRFIDYDKDSYKDQWTGKGYYKSSYRNAMRVARTETNIAYRTADNERWQQMDFVLGVKIQLSHSHPMPDICDTLSAKNGSDNQTGKGCYPKDFKFTGWHPQCFCYAIPILISEDEMEKVVDSFAEGKEYTPQGKQISDYPNEFKKWVEDSKDNLQEMKKRGTTPYFVRDNQNVVNKILSGEDIGSSSITRRTPLENAAERHAKRTDADIRRIQDMSDERTYGKAYVENVHKIEQALGMNRSKRMTHEQADLGKVNPNYYTSKGYRINCSTCSATYMLRRMGFNVEAKANVSSNAHVNALSKGVTTWEKWIDGLSSYNKTTDWMSAKGYKKMTSKRYMEFCEEMTKSPGIYELNIGYSRNRGGHSTLLMRTEGGDLIWIEQQVMNNTTDLNSLINVGLVENPSLVRGILKIDDKLFNPVYADIVEVVK